MKFSDNELRKIEKAVKNWYEKILTDEERKFYSLLGDKGTVLYELEEFAKRFMVDTGGTVYDALSEEKKGLDIQLKREKARQIIKRLNGENPKKDSRDRDDRDRCKLCVASNPYGECTLPDGEKGCIDDSKRRNKY